MIVFFLLLSALQGPSVSSQALKATMRFEVAHVTAAPGADNGPLAGFGPLLAQMLTPDGPVAIEWYGNSDGVRATLRSRVSILPAGAVVIQRAGASTIQVLSPANRTYFEVPAAGSDALQALSGASAVPDMQIRPTGDIAVVAGERAERHEVVMTFKLALPDTAAGSAVPRELQVVGDLWLTRAFAAPEYAGILKTLDSLIALPGLSAAIPPGEFPLKTRLRLTAIPDYEIRSEVTALATAPLPTDAFAVPAGFRKVDAPMGGVTR